MDRTAIAANAIQMRAFSSATAGAFSSEVETGSRQENASNQESRTPFRFYRNGAQGRYRGGRTRQGETNFALAGQSLIRMSKIATGGFGCSMEPPSFAGKTRASGRAAFPQGFRRPFRGGG